MPDGLAAILLDRRSVTQAQLDWAKDRQRRHLCSLGQVLLSHGLVDEDDLYSGLAAQYRTQYIAGADCVADPQLIDRLDAGFCVRHDVLPVRRAGALTLVATSNPAAFARIKSRIETRLGPVAMVVMARDTLQQSLRDLRRNRLVKHAETRVDPAESCRNLSPWKGWATALFVVLSIAAAAIAAPVASFAVLAVLACTVAAINTALLLAAPLLVPPGRNTPPDDTTLTLARLPPVSILVPLFDEREIATALLDRLSLLRYPRELLDVCMIVEDCDLTTRRALARATLPRWMRVVAVPKGSIRTKPRAMNFSLDFCRGDIVGIYDAEDAPPPDQLLRVVHQFARAPARVGCLQGQLNFYNARASWLTRCFAIDYGTWFTLILPALHRLNWSIPLGGTTVFFRTSALRDVGAWDAHNVTEDADLGMRLARRGYRTDLLPSVTLEEATSSARAWINQRSRWQKGYAITWLVHMRAPLRLLRDLGLWRFVGLQVLFLGSLLGALFAPVLWSFVLLALGLPHPLQGEWSIGPSILLAGTLVSSLVVNAAVQITALRRTGALSLLAAVPLMHVYHALSSIALVKALYELVFRPYFWHKTAHGVTPPDAAVTATVPAPHRV